MVLLLLLALLAGCATINSQKIEMIPILEAEREIPEDQLLDVGISIFESESVTAAEVEKQGTSAEIRKAEEYYMPYHLKDTLQRTSHWGTVRVVPAATGSSELLIRGKIIESNGEYLCVHINADRCRRKALVGKKI